MTQAENSQNIILMACSPVPSFPLKLHELVFIGHMSLHSGLLDTQQALLMVSGVQLRLFHIPPADLQSLHITWSNLL